MPITKGARYICTIYAKVKAGRFSIATGTKNYTMSNAIVNNS